MRVTAGNTRTSKACEGRRFAIDSLLEGGGFELPVPELVGRCGVRGRPGCGRGGPYLTCAATRPCRCGGTRAKVGRAAPSLTPTSQFAKR